MQHTVPSSSGINGKTLAQLVVDETSAALIDKRDLDSLFELQALHFFFSQLEENKYISSCIENVKQLTKRIKNRFKLI